MKTAVHQYEDKLLEFAYGELPAHEAAAVDAHVRGCPRCSEALSQIRSVRSTMSQLPMAPAPDAGLESLLAYAEQTAKRNADTKKKDVWWRRYLMPLASVTALMLVGVVAWRASQDFNPDPAMIALDMQKEREKAQAPVAVAPAAPAPTEAAQAKAGAKTELAEKTAEAKAETLNTDFKAKGESSAGFGQGNAEALGVREAERRKGVAPQPRLDAMAKADKLADAPADQAAKQGLLSGDTAEGGGGLGRVQDNVALESSGTKMPATKAPAKPSPAPQSQAKRDTKPAPSKVALPDERAVAMNYSDASRAGANKKAAPKTNAPVAKDVATKEVADDLSKNQLAAGNEPVWGLGAGKAGGLGTGPGSAMGGVATGGSSSTGFERSAPEMKKSKKKAEPVQEAPVRQEEQFAQAVQPPPPPAPQVATAQPQAEPTPVAATSAPSNVPKKGSLGVSLSTRGSGSSTYGAAEDEAVQVASDGLASDKEAALREREQAAVRTKYLEAARAASNRNDRMTEVKYALEVLNAGAKGYERVESLKRLCDAYEAMGEYDRAQPYCDTLLRESPNTAAAQAVAQRRNRAQKAPAPAKRAVDRKYDFDVEEKAAEPASKPVETAPAQAY